MKKVIDFVKPNILIILGGLMLLTYLNYLMGQGEMLVYGIFGVTIAAFYIAYGILSILMASKLSEQLNKILNVVAVSLFGAFIFTANLMSFIGAIDDSVNGYNAIGPTGWALLVISLFASLGFVTFFILSKFVKNDLFTRLAYLLTGIFALALLINFLFDYTGFPNSIDDIPLVPVVVDVLFVFYAVSSLNKLEAKKEVAPAAKEEKEEEQIAPEANEAEEAPQE